MRRFDFNLKAIKHLKTLEENFKHVENAPVSIAIHPTNNCNANCPMCRYAGLNRAETIPFHILNRTVEELGEIGVKSIILSGGGEPTIYRGLEHIIYRAGQSGLQIGLVTNFIRVKGELIGAIAKNCSWVRISLDAATSETYSKIHGTTPNVFHKVLTNIEILLSENNCKPTVGASMIVQKNNFREVNRFLDLCGKLGLDYAQFRPVQHESPTAPTIQKKILDLTAKERTELKHNIESYLKNSTDKIPSNLDSLIGLFSTLETLNKKDYNRCLSTYIVSSIGADSYVYPCCQVIGDSKFRIEKINRKTFAEIWRSRKYEKLRKEINPDKCPPCRYHFYNETFESYMNGWRPEKQQLIEATHTPDSDFL